MIKRKRRELPENVLILGSGPIVIGQGCEFDYSGTQACRALKEEGVRVVLLNSNPATIMTDPAMADQTYIEPLDPGVVMDIIRRENIQAILPTMGGQTGLNLILALSQIPHALDGVKVIGANIKSIHLAEDRRAFREVIAALKMDAPRSAVIRSIEECREFADKNGFPFILRPSFTLGGTGQDFVYSVDELERKTETALRESPIGEVLVEESVLGWKEFELEVMRDQQDNAIVVCSIENVDPMGIHTGESVTVAPAQTLTDREYQSMRTDALRIIRSVGVETGGCNVQFAVNPRTGRRIVIEMNPRVSRSSALASKATGFPIAYVATKLALGYVLPEIQNHITGTTKTCFEPPLDYVAVKIPRWHFEKFPGAVDMLGSQMQSVGEVLAFGGSFGEAFHKALNSLEKTWPISKDERSDVEKLKEPTSLRPYAVWDTLASGTDPDELAGIMDWDPWFTRNIRRYQQEESLGQRATRLPERMARFQMIDTSAGETRAKTAFFYSTREKLGGMRPTVPHELEKGKRGRVVILGSGPNRIGQGIEFDYCCVHASLVLQKLGFETIMVNCNPETVSTDPAVSTRLYLEPLCDDSVRSILEYELAPLKLENIETYVLVQTGGQTPLKLAEKIEQWGYRILGTQKAAIDLCEDRGQFADVLTGLKISYPKYAVAINLSDAQNAAKSMGFPILVRPSYVLGGRGMKICSNESELEDAFAQARKVNDEYPLYLDKFLNEAVEFDIDGICDGKKAWIAGVLEHVEEAGIHSGDSSCVIPPFRLPVAKIEEMAALAKKIAIATNARGFFNIQMAVMGEDIFVLEANPRASRTIPFLSKATGYRIVEWALRAALGESVADIVKEAKMPGDYRLPSHGYAVKTPVFPFNKFRNVDPLFGPEMRSTGEVMGVAKSAGAALAKAFIAAGTKLPTGGGILMSVRDRDKPRAQNLARLFHLLGFKIYGTPGTADYLNRAGIACTSVAKIGFSGDDGVDVISVLRDGNACLVINTTASLGSLKDGRSIRTEALRFKVPVLSTLVAGEMAAMAIEEIRENGLRPMAVQEFLKSR